MFRIGDATYAVEATRVVEVVPWVELRSVPVTVPGVAGLLNYRGVVVPVVDVGLLVHGKECRRLLSTRILIVAVAAAAGERQLGLLAESVLRAAKDGIEEFKQKGVFDPARPFLGPVECEGTDLVQRIEPEALLTEQLHQALLADRP